MDRDTNRDRDMDRDTNREMDMDMDMGPAEMYAYIIQYTAKFV
jgi:hypothetical protein